MKYTHNADGSTTTHYTKEEWQKYEHYRKLCEETLTFFHHPNDMERVYNVLAALAEIGSEDNTDALCALETQIEALGGTIQ